MTRFLSFVLGLLVLAGIIYLFYSGDFTGQLDGKKGYQVANLESWHEYKAPYGQFHVLLPSLPHHATETLPDPKTKEMRNYEIFVSNKDDGSNYSISIITFPENKDIQSDEIFLQNFIDDTLAANEKNKLKSSNLGTFKNGKAIDFNLENEDLVVFGKAFLDGKKLYVLSSTTKLGNHNPQEYDFFINSFQLISVTSPKEGAVQGK